MTYGASGFRMEDSPGSFDSSLGDWHAQNTGTGMSTAGYSHLGAGFGDSLDMPLGFADQACKECRRRKSKCNKAMPTCNLCVKYRRHCLYEKHSRTPLTRKHLTEVEERLERAEGLVRQMRAFLPPHLQPQKNQRSRATAGDASFDFSNLHRPLSASSNIKDEEDASLERQKQPDGSEDAPYDVEATPTPVPSTDPASSKATEYSRDANRGMSTILESPPATDDFEWDEQDNMATASCSPDNINDPDEAALDGMASLAVSEKEAGYLGVASGAALLRLLEPSIRRRSSQPRSRPSMTSYPSLSAQPNPNRHIADSMIDAYFRLFHLNYPIVHEPTFRAQYSELIPRPNGDSWLVLAYVIAALGVFSSATNLDNLDLELFARARSILSFNFLELGNLTLVQALTLTSNYQQKRDRPNSGYNYLGLAVRMAMGLGLHKEFQGWNISPLNMEIRRRVWWCIGVLDSGATITFSRPLTWPYEGVEVSLPKNFNDRELTPNSHEYPPETDEITPYTAVRVQVGFHLATNPIYTRLIGKPLPTAEELLRLDKERLEPWVQGVPDNFAESATVPQKYIFARDGLSWRWRNFRIIMYRPFVIRKALQSRDGQAQETGPDIQAYKTCLADAKFCISSISGYWATHEHNRFGAWYALYFLFQAALIPCICLRNTPLAEEAADWRSQISTTLQTIAALAPVNPSAARCYQTIAELCGRYLDPPPSPFPHATSTRSTPSNYPTGTDHNDPGGSHTHQQQQQEQQGIQSQVAPTGPSPSSGFYVSDEMIPIDESPQTQINSVFSMIWPNVSSIEAADMVMGDDAWMDFLRGEGAANDGRHWYAE